MSKMVIRVREVCAAITLQFFVMLSPASAEEASINFRDVEIVSAIESISVLTGKTFIVDPRVRGKVSIISNNAMDSESVYDIFLSALSVQGFQAINDGKAVRIIPAAKAANLSNFSGNAEFLTEVVSISKGSAEEYLSILKPLIGAGGLVTHHRASNSLVISDTQVQIDRFKQMLADLERSADKSYELVTLQYANAAELVAIATQTGILDERTTVVADKLSNRLIIAFDGDKAGFLSANKATQLALQIGKK